MFSDFVQWKKGDNEQQAATIEEPEETTMAPEELERFLRQLFYQADVESSGYLHPRAFAQLLRSSGLGFSNKTIRKVVEEADVNGDGWIDYLEYVSTMVQIIQSQQARNRQQQRTWEDEARARAAATEFILQGVSRDWLERSILKMFMQADLNNNGTLDTAEFVTCLRSCDLGLSRKEITWLMSEVDVNQDGVVSYQEFVPLCFDLMVELIKDKFLQDHGALRLQEYFVDIFREYDNKGSGKVSLSQLRESLSLASLNLTAVQVQAVVAEARQDEGGLVSYQPFSRVAAQMVMDMLGAELPSIRDTPGTGLVETMASGAVQAAAPLTPEVEAMVSRYEGDREAVKARSLASTPGLRGKLSDLASQLARVQDENDAIRQRYLELEDAWTSMGDENGALVKRVAALEAELRTSNKAKNDATALNRSLESKLGEVHSSFLESRDLAEATKQSLIAEQLELGKKTKESELLRRETMVQESELRKLREAWNDREARLERLEEQRSFYEQQLSELGSSYQALVDKLSYVATDHSVRTAPVQVRVGGGYEVLSNYLNRVFEEQDHINAKYKKAAAQAPLSPHLPMPFPFQVTPSTSPTSAAAMTRKVY
jgi:Ca2+-binding EF-hand superfamily protein